MVWTLANNVLQKILASGALIRLVVLLAGIYPLMVTAEPTNFDSVPQDSESLNPAAQFRLGKQYDKGEGVPQDKAQALSWYRKAAERGYPEAQLLLGIMYDQGVGVAQDYAQAITWYRKAAEQNYAKAQYNLAGMYDEGLGLEQDYQQAAVWYLKAAQQGYAKAQFNLGSMYFNAEGVEQDNVQGYMWLQLAAKQGLKHEVKKRLALVKNLTTAEIKLAKKLVREWNADHRNSQVLP